MYKAEQLKLRTKQFALRVIKLYRSSPKGEDARVIGRQVLRSATSVGANYRAVRRARTKAEFIAKIGIVGEKTDESLFWLELFVDSGIISAKRMESLLVEANELLAIFAASQRTAKAHVE